MKQATKERKKINLTEIPPLEDQEFSNADVVVRNFETSFGSRIHVSNGSVTIPEAWVFHESHDYSPTSPLAP
ncbi:MAG: hypothetical protein GY804_12100 [Alphaproteobacteria bacterium]|nr:hypothetical protein [Alphaproteobacteria bacterium]